MSHKTTKRYVGFYLIEGLWAEAKPDYSKFGSQYWIKPEYWALMEEVVIEVKDGDKSIVVFRDGLIAYSDDELTNQGADDDFYKRIHKYGEILNAIFAIFVSKITEATKIKYHTNFEVTHHNIIPLTFENGKQTSMGIPQKSITDKQLDKRMLMNVPDGYINDLDHWIDFPPRTVVPKPVLIDGAYTYFEISKNSAAIRMLARSNKATSEYASTAFSDCVLTSWIQIEIYLYAKLKNYMTTQGNVKFPSKRRKALLASASSQIIEVLEVAGELDASFYTLLAKVRKVRNDIVHKGYTANIEEATDSLHLFEEVIYEHTNESIHLNTGISMNLF